MARIYNTPDTERYALAWIHDLLIAGGLRSDNKKSTSFNPSPMFVASAKTICTELLNRNFSNIDRAFQNVNGMTYNASFDANNVDWRVMKADAAAKAVVFFAEKCGLYWDDTVMTGPEISEFQKTILGKFVYKYGRYISAVTNKSVTRASRGAGSSSSGSGQGSSFKQSGPQSGNARDLKGTPGNKVYANTPISYKIIGEFTGNGKTANAFIKPLTRSGATGSTNKVLISSGRGFGDCVCFFDEKQEADAFLAKLLNSNRVPSNVINLRVVKVDSDPNGYFLVGTEFGLVAVRAVSLNEALDNREAAELLGEDYDNEWSSVVADYSDEQLMEFYEKLLGD